MKCSDVAMSHSGLATVPRDTPTVPHVSAEHYRGLLRAISGCRFLLPFASIAEGNGPRPDLPISSEERRMADFVDELGFAGTGSKRCSRRGPVGAAPVIPITTEDGMP